ncbi:MAG TPA: peptidylprolyl isomerase [Bacteroidetes bacterium]|nr:peptidylprolyl isomerase [Bacteroidota bacterium]
MGACESNKKIKTRQEDPNSEVKSSEAPVDTPAIPASTEPEKKNMMVEIVTDHGTMKVLLYDETPLHRDNFIKLVEEGYYNDLLFHRIIKGFMIQGGDPNSKNAGPGVQLGGGGPGYTVPAEFRPGLYHKKGALAAARMGDQMNPQRASSGSQFYIVQGTVVQENMLQRSGIVYTPEQIQTYTTIGGTPFLDGQYTVFGEVVEGLDVIDKIAAVKTLQGDRPEVNVKMTVRTVKK